MTIEDEFNGVCPFCRSNEIEVVDSSPVEWGNNDEGLVGETWQCNNCKSMFNTDGQVCVTSRVLQLFITCPYCQENDDIEMKNGDSIDDPNNIWYHCNHCNREFAIHPEKWYKGLIE